MESHVETVVEEKVQDFDCTVCTIGVSLNSQIKITI